MDEVMFGEKFFAIIEEDEAKDKDYNEWNQNNCEIVEIVREKLR